MAGGRGFLRTAGYGLAAKLAEIVDSTFSVLKSDGTAGLRFRSTGAAVDIDKMNGDVVESSFAGPGFTGAQTAIRRLRNNGQTLVGLTEFGTTAYAAEQTISAATGTANLGAKNGLTNVQLCGFKATAGAPTTGTWALGNVVLDSAGAWHLCTVAGTPGTWT